MAHREFWYRIKYYGAAYCDECDGEVTVKGGRGEWADGQYVLCPPCHNRRCAASGLVGEADAEAARAPIDLAAVDRKLAELRARQGTK
jgi:hypothetical protein